MAADKDMVPIQTRLPKEVATTLKEIAEIREVSQAQLIRDLVETYLDELDLDAIAKEMRERADQRIAQLRGVRKPQ